MVPSVLDYFPDSSSSLVLVKYPECSGSLELVQYPESSGSPSTSLVPGV